MLSLYIARVVGKSYTLGVVYWKKLKLYMKLQFIGNFKVTQYFVTIIGSHFQWLEFHIKIHMV